jgi:hypothetical protein
MNTFWAVFIWIILDLLEGLEKGWKRFPLFGHFFHEERMLLHFLKNPIVS